MTTTTTERLDGSPSPDGPDGPDARHVHHAGTAPVLTAEPLRGRTVALLAVAALGLAAGLFLLGWLPHAKRVHSAAEVAREAARARPAVEVVAPRSAGAELELTLPADLRANQATSVYARTNGYLKALPPGIDIGTRVAAGQLIAEISAPEIDADLARARAAAEQTQAALARAKDELAFQTASFERYDKFASTGGLTKQQLEERRQQLNNATTGLTSAEANAHAAAAEHKRLQELQSFERVTAPFAGVLTYRGYDAGAIVSTSEVGPGKELFRIEDTSVLRARIGVPQSQAAAIEVGQPAELSVRSRPGQTFSGKVARTAGAIDPATRMMHVEVDFENAGGQLLPGAFGQARLRIRRASPVWLVPTSAIAFGSDGTRVAVLEGDHVRFRKIVLDRDHGTVVEVHEGLNGTERLVNNPTEELRDGLEVEVRPARQPDSRQEGRGR